MQQQCVCWHIYSYLQCLRLCRSARRDRRYTSWRLSREVPSCGIAWQSFQEGRNVLFVDARLMHTRQSARELLRYRSWSQHKRRRTDWMFLRFSSPPSSPRLLRLHRLLNIVRNPRRGLCTLRLSLQSLAVTTAWLTSPTSRRAHRNWLTLWRGALHFGITFHFSELKIASQWALISPLHAWETVSAVFDIHLWSIPRCSLTVRYTPTCRLRRRSPYNWVRPPHGKSNN